MSFRIMFRALLLSLSVLGALPGRALSAPGDATVPDDRATWLSLSMERCPFSSSGRLEAYYEDCDLAGGILIERPWTSRLHYAGGLDYFPFPFDEAAFYQREGVSPAVPVDAESAKLLAASLGVRVYPFLRSPVRPFLGVSVVYGTLKEKYSYSNLQSGPVFPSGTWIGRNRSDSVRGFGGTIGLLLPISPWVQPFVEVSYLWLTGASSDLRLVPLRGGISIAVS